MAELNERMARLESDVAHVKDILDNHVMSALDKIRIEISTLCVAVRLDGYWIGIWRKTFWIAVTAIVSGSVATAFFLLREPK
jgi:hypothetical protein